MRNGQRTDNVRPFHAFAAAGLYGGGGPTADSRNIGFSLNAVYNIAGTILHIEDATPGVIALGNMGQAFETGIEIVNDAIPYLQAYGFNSFSGWTTYAIDNVGSGSSQQISFTFNLFDGAGSTVASGPNIRINQQATRDINYVGNHHRNFTGDGMEVTADGRVHVAYNSWDTISGNAFLARSGTTTRGLQVHSNNSFRSVGGIISKSVSASLMGDQHRHGVVIGSVAHEEVLLHAKKPGFLVKVVRAMDETVLSGTNGQFTVLKRTSGGTETTLLTNSIPNAFAAYNVTEWGAEHAQILVHTWDAGDMIILRSDGASAAARSASVQIEYFEYN
ncbi:MAG: hypothetical protein EBT13_16805 [Rhodobacteraceae bacterium]|nr:hypothetical protein [Paracoccaceae bacterium]